MIDTAYTDAFGVEHAVPPETLETLREAMGEPGDGEPLFAHPGETPAVGPAEVVLEDGTALEIVDRLPPDLPLGYHRLVDAESERRLVVSPGRCHLPEGLAEWGWSVQLYAARTRHSWGMGDFADLEQLTHWARDEGAGIVLVNPLLAVSPTLPQQPSPYFPASRRFLNPIYLRVERVTGGEQFDGAVTARALNHSPTIDRDEVWRLKLRALESIWEEGTLAPEFSRWAAGQGDSLEEFGVWSTLAEQHGPDWRAWPKRLAHPSSPAVKRALRESRDRVRFHQWLQWLCRDQLEAAARPVMLMHDLPIGFDPGGADAWAWQDVIAPDVSVGAPPDEFNTRGQDWGLPPFIPHRLRSLGYEPLIQTVRTNLLAGGGLRIDHVMGIFRQFWIPAGASPRDGAYVRFASDELLDIIALESVRAGAVVVGEDLGTVEAGVREELARRRLLSYRLLWFEEDEPRRWPEMSMASVTTHDLPTVMGLWTGADLKEQRDLDMAPNEESTERIRSRVAHLADLTESPAPHDLVTGVYRCLADAPSRLVCLSLDDLALAERRPNIPGADSRRPNWSLALPSPLEDLTVDPLAGELATIFNGDGGRTGGDRR